jgi:hypothetical protein
MVQEQIFLGYCQMCNRKVLHDSFYSREKLFDASADRSKERNATAAIFDELTCPNSYEILHRYESIQHDKIRAEL